MKIKKSIVSVGKSNYKVIQFNCAPPKDKDILENSMHFIEILEKDRRIITYIDELIEDVRNTTYAEEARMVVYKYRPIFKQCFKVIENISSTIINIKCEGKSILHLTKRNVSLEQNSLKVNLSKSINKFYVISPPDEEFEFTINDEVFHSSKIKRILTDFDIKTLLYTLAYDEYYRGNTAEALDILNISLRDKYLTKLALNAFTFKEREKCTDIILKAAHNKKIKTWPRTWKKARMVEGTILCNEIIEESPCFMDLLAVFEGNGDRFIPIPPEKYRRIGKKVIDNYNAFKIDKSVRLAADFKELVFSKEKLNISIRYEIPGFVTINPRQAKAVGFKTNIFSGKIFREQTIIKDGDINIDRFHMLATKDTLKYLGGLNIIGLFSFIDKNDYSHNNYTLIEIDISKIPILSRGYVTKCSSLESILEIYYNQRIAECKQKVIKYFIERCSRNLLYQGLKYTKEQYKLLESYGLDSRGIYHGIDNNVVNKENNQYECRFFEFALKGFSKLPKVEELLTKITDGIKKLNNPETVMANYIKYLSENKLITKINELNKLLEEEKSIIRTNTRILAEIKLVKALTGSWWQELKLDSKNNYFYEKDDKTLIIKAIRKQVSI